MSWWSISRYVPQRIQNFPDGRRYRRLANTKLVAIILICPAVVWIIVNGNNNTAAVVSSCRIKCLLVSLHQVRHGNHKQTNSRARDNSFAAIQLEFLWQPTPAIIVRQRKDKPFENKLQRSLVKKTEKRWLISFLPKNGKKGCALKNGSICQLEPKQPGHCVAAMRPHYSCRSAPSPCFFVHFR